METLKRPDGLAEVRFQDARTMDLEAGSVKLLIGAGVHLDAPWEEYSNLYRRVYVAKGLPSLQRDGAFVCFQGDQYIGGRVEPQSTRLLTEMLFAYQLLDRKVWRRKRADFRFPPLTDVYVLVPPNSTLPRTKLNSNPRYFQALWDYPMGKRVRKHIAFPWDLCRMLVSTFTHPGDLVVDPFTGSGRILGVAAAMGRRAIGYEIDEGMRAIIQQNLTLPALPKEL